MASAVSDAHIRTLLASGASVIAVHYATGAHVVRVFCLREQMPVPTIPRLKPTTAWPQEDVALLLELMKAGNSPTRIAELMPHRSRNSIIGTQHRYNLVTLFGIKHPPKISLSPVRMQAEPPKRPAKSAPPAPRPAAPVSTEPEAPAEEIADISDDGVPIEQRVRILIAGPHGLEANPALTDDCCRWPLGDPQSPDFGYCGRETVPGLPYCRPHGARAFAPATPRRRRGSSAAPVVPSFADAEKELQ